MIKPSLYSLLGQTLLLTAALSIYGCVTQQQFDALREQQQKDMQALSAQISALTQQLQGQAKNTAKSNSSNMVDVSSQDRDILGDPNAPVTIVEFTDYQCPFCKRFTDNTLPALKAEFIDTGKVKLLIKDLALSGHKQARQAAQASRCAGEQGRYWAMHDLLFANSKNLALEAIAQLALKLKLDITQFEQCLASGRHMAAIDADIAEAQQLGITGTPAFVIGKSNAEQGGMIKGQLIIGAKTIDVFKSRISLLK